ncbi:MAG: leucine-rich repeat domain-containing protein, partial [Chloroflexota bacterium]
MKLILRIILFTTVCFLYASVPQDVVTAHMQPQQTEFDCTTVSEIPQIECEALVIIYNETGGPDWSLRNYWLQTTTPCDGWSGVRCSGGHVTALGLDNDNKGNNLIGLLPSVIGDFRSLKALDLSGNKLSSIPVEIGTLSNLEVLSLSSNQLSSIPTEISNLSNLSKLYLNDNNLSSIPTEISNLNLAWLYLNDNQLSNIPVKIGNLSNLATLDLSSNKLSSIPVEIGNLNLVRLYLNDNQLSSIPVEIGNLRNLTTLDLSSNKLSSIPTEIGNLSNLSELYLNDNQLSSIPTEISNFSNLSRFDLSRNQLSSIPTEISNLSNLLWFDLSWNQLGNLPVSVTQLINLNHLSLSNNYLTGISEDIKIFLDDKDPDWAEAQPFSCLNVREIPQIECEALVAIYRDTGGPNWKESINWLQTRTPCSWSGVGCNNGNVTRLSLVGFRSNNNLVGVLPHELGNLFHLTSLEVYNNKLSGIPSELGNLSNLTTLNLAGNKLSSIPSALGNLSNLKYLYLSINQLSSIPSELGNLSNLTYLELYRNQLNSIPSELGNLSNLDTLELNHNQLSNIPAGLGNLSNLRDLDLYNNQLRSIPSELGNLSNLTYLELYNNQLSSIPSELGNLANLTFLDLSNNHLSSIPSELGNLSNLTSLSVSKNQLSSIPSELSNLPNLNVYFGYNRVVITNDDLASFLGSDWSATQTIAPTNVTATVLSDHTLQLSWTPIAFQDKGGYYEIYIENDGTYTKHGETHTKSDGNYVISGLETDTSYSFRIRTYTPAHDWVPPIHFGWIGPYPDDDQRNELWSEYSDEISITTPKVADDYESDNTCVQSTTIETTGRSQSHNFHHSGDEDWIKFTAPATRTYRVEVDIPNNSRADVDLFYYTNCDVLSTDRWTETFAPGVRLDINATAGQTYYLKLSHFDDSVAGRDVSYDVSVRPLPLEDEEPRRAVIIVAGRYRLNDTLQDNIDETAEHVYQMFQAQRMEADEILVLAASNIEGYDDDVTNDNLRRGITQWAVEQLTSDAENPVNSVLNLYIIDHGDPDRIYLDEFKDERLTPAELDGWLTELEAAVPGVVVNVIIEACHAGSFIEQSGNAGRDSISHPGRVIVASTSADSDAYASRNGIHFSDNFITLLQQGRDLATSFGTAKNIVQLLYGSQEPWIDANGNGIPNEFDDAQIARERGFNYAGTLGDNWPPHIFVASLPNAVNDRSGTIHADIRDDKRVQDVWAVIYPPGYIAPTSENELVAETVGTDT